MFWLALAIFLVASFGSLGYAASRAWRLWRAFRSTSRRLSDAIARVADAGAAAERRALALSTNGERLAAASARLQESLAALAVIRQAASEPGALLSSVRSLDPRT